MMAFPPGGGGGGGSTPGAGRVIGPFPFAFNTANIANGVNFYIPTVGDVLLDALVSIVTAFDGTTPRVDIGTFAGGNAGLFGAFNSAIFATVADSAVPLNAGINQTLQFASLSCARVTKAAAGSIASPPWQLKFTAATPLQVVLSQTGQKGGAAPGGTVGAANIYLTVATPSAT